MNKLLLTILLISLSTFPLTAQDSSEKKDDSAQITDQGPEKKEYTIQVTAKESEKKDESIEMDLLGASDAVRTMPLSDIPVKSLYMKEDEENTKRYGFSKSARVWYRDIYPAIDLACYSDEYMFEYIFILHTGADPDNIRMRMKDVATPEFGHGGDLIFRMNNAEIVQKAPVVFMHDEKSKRRISGQYNVDRQNRVNLVIDEFLKKQEALNNTQLNIIPGKGQPCGPEYDFYMSKFEVSNEQFLKFLNDAQANIKDVKGRNMFFDAKGNIWFDPDMKKETHRLFDISQSRFVYKPQKPVGQRYEHQRDAHGNTLYLRHPVTGMSWYGALKYCNWLTIESGRSIAECCYTEGLRPSDWAPVTATNWAAGLFGDAERTLWLSLKGFRLPMINCLATMLTTNNFSEFQKAGSWHANTNRLFGYGRDTFDGTDANTVSTLGKPKPGTMPVGYFEGNNFLGTRLTHDNENYYGLFDLTGNAAEWMNDHGRKGYPNSRALCGGTFQEKPIPIYQGKIVAPNNVSMAAGIRPTTTYAPEETMFIHVLYTFFMEPATQVVKEIPEQKVELTEIEKIEAPEEAYPEKIKPEEISEKTAGLVYKETPEEVVPGEQPAEGGGGGPPPKLTTNMLTVTSVNPDQDVLIQVSPDDISMNGDGSTPFTRTYMSQSGVVLTAPRSALGTNAFTRWLRNGETYGLNTKVSFLITGAFTMTAEYLPARSLTVTSTPYPGVRVSTSPDINLNISSLTSFTNFYPRNALVTLVVPKYHNETNTFGGWLQDGVVIGTSEQLSVNMDRDIALEASYIPPRSLTIESIPESGITITTTPDLNSASSGSTTFTNIYLYNSTVTVSAPADAGTNNFIRWLRDGVEIGRNTNLTLVMDTNITIIADYIPPKELIVKSTPDSGITITTTPDVYSRSSGDTTFTNIYLINASITVSAPLISGINAFARWTQDGVVLGISTNLDLVMSSNITITAEYETPRTLTVMSIPDTGLTITTTPDVNLNTFGLTIFTNRYIYNSIATVTAPDASGSNAFVQWTRDGVVIGVNTSIDLLMDTNMTIIAEYVPPRLLVVQSTPVSGITITTTPDVNSTNSGSTTFTNRYMHGTPITATAPATVETNTFFRWTRDGVVISTNTSVDLIMDANITITAEYLPPQLLIVKSAPVDNITISTTPDVNSTNSGSTTFTNRYMYNTPVTVTAPAVSGSNTFSQWLQDGVSISTNTSVDLVMNSNITITAEYTLPKLLTVQSTPVNGITITTTPDVNSTNSGNTIFTNTYLHNTPITVTAPDISGTNTFFRWNRGGVIISSNTTIDLIMDVDITVTAEYIPPQRLIVRSTPANGITITNTIDVNSNSYGRTTYTNYYMYNAPVTVTAPPVSGTNTFLHWMHDGVIISTNTSIDLIMDSEITVWAEYIPPKQLAIRSTPVSGITITTTPDVNSVFFGRTSFTNRYMYNTIATATAPAVSGTNTFVQWTRDGVVISTNTSVSLLMDTNITIVAEYILPQQLVVKSTPFSGVLITTTRDINNTLFGNTTFTNRYIYNTTITVSAPLVAGSNSFVMWTRDGIIIGTNTSVSLVMNTNITITAEYEKPRYLTVQSLPDSGITMTTTPDLNANTSGSTTFTNAYPFNWPVTVSAPFLVGSNVFIRWMRDGSTVGTDTNLSLVMSTNIIVTAIYEPPRFLTVKSLPDSGITITTTPDVNFVTSGNTTFTNTYPYNWPVTISAPLVVGSNSFLRWMRDGIEIGTSTNLSLVMNTNITVTAEYEPPRFLTVKSLPDSGVTITTTPDVNTVASGDTTFTNTYPYNWPVTISAPLVVGSNSFVRWIRDGIEIGTSTNLSLVMNTNITVTAEYEPPRFLTVKSLPDSGITMTTTPDVNAVVSGNTTFTNTYLFNQPVTISAPAIVGSNIFIRWIRDGIEIGTNTALSLVMSTNITVTAEYELPRYLTVQSLPDSGVTITTTPDINSVASDDTTFTNTYFFNTPVSISAPPIVGSNSFIRWTINGIEVGTTTNLSLVMDTNITVTAFYEPSRQLIVKSFPDSGIRITTTPDLNLVTSGNTTFTNTYLYNTPVSISAPAIVGSNVFTLWTIDGLEVGATTNLSLVMDTNITVTAVYESPKRLIVLSTNPVSGVDIQVSATDIFGHGNGTTAFTNIYSYGTAVSVTAPATNTGGFRLFARWLRDNVFETENQTANVIMDTNITMTAVYTNPTLKVSLQFIPTVIGLGDFSTLTSSPSGGSGNYINYQYEYDMHFISRGFTVWTSSIITTISYTFDWDHYIKYHVKVQDDTLIWSEWSNEAYLYVTNGPPEFPPWKSESGLL